MELKNTGTIELDNGYNARLTPTGEWHVSRNGMDAGYASSLVEAEMLAARDAAERASRAVAYEPSAYDLDAESRAERQAEQAGAMRLDGNSCQGFDHDGNAY